MSDGAARSPQRKHRSACSVHTEHEKLPEHSVFRHKIIRCRLNEPQDCSKSVRLHALSRASIRTMRQRNTSTEPSSEAGGAMVAPATSIMRFRKGSDPEPYPIRFASPPAPGPSRACVSGSTRCCRSHKGEPNGYQHIEIQDPRRPHANLARAKSARPRAAPLDRDPLLRRAPSRQSPRHRKRLRRLLLNRKRCSRCFEKRRAPLSPRS